MLRLLHKGDLQMEGFEEYVPKPHLSQSSANCLARCARKFFYAHGIGLESRTKHCALAYGEALHFALADACDGDLDKALESFRSVWQDTEGDDLRNEARARIMLKEFIRVYKQCPFETIEPPKGIAISERVSKQEVPFALDLGIGVPVVGRIDAVARNKNTGELWAVEYKTSRETSSRFFAGFAMSPQLGTMTLALTALSGERTQGVLLTALSTAKTNHNVMIMPIFQSDVLLGITKKWYETLWRKLETCELEEDFPCEFGACSPYPYFGCPGFMCEYAPLCQATDWRALRDLFVVRERKHFCVKEEESE
jgi:hypothetical protein